MERFQYNPEADSMFTPVAASPLTPFSPFRSAEPTSLPTWDQVAQGNYISVALTFPFDGDKKTIEAHLKTSLYHLSRQHKNFAARLKIDPHTGRVSIEKHSTDEIPFEVIDHGDKLPYTYGQLKAKGFAASAFVHPDFVADGALGPFSLVPVSQVRLSFIDGGLILWVYLHHIIADGDGLHKYLECFAAATRGQKADQLKNTKFNPPSKDSNAGEDSSSSSSASPSSGAGSGISSPRSFEAIISRGPEHTAAPSFTQPRPRPDWYAPVVGTPAAQTNYHRANALLRGPPRKGNTFVFRSDRLAQLASLVEAIHPASRPPSADAALAALTWAHATRARLAAEGADAEAMGLAGGPARLLLLPPLLARADGRAAGRGPAAVERPAADVVAACEDFRAVVPLADAIVACKAAGSADDEGPAAGAARLDADGNKPHHLVFNTWRSLGMDTEWVVPGVSDEAVGPAAVRPARGGTALGYAHVLPGRVDSEVLEMVVYIPEAATEALMEDEDYMRWVDHVVE